MIEANIINNFGETYHGIDEKELLNDIMGMEAKAEVIFSKMRSRVITSNFPGVLNYFNELNYLLNHYQNKYSDLSEIKNEKTISL